MLPPNTIVPEDKSLYISYFNRLYEDIAFTVNNKDAVSFPIQITSIPQNIPNLPNFGSYVVAVGPMGRTADGSFPPTLNASLSKSSPSVAGVIAVLSSQAGQGGGIWGGFVLTITSTATNFQIAHNNTGVTGNFLIRIVGTFGAL